VARSERSRANATQFGGSSLVADIEVLPAVDGAVVATPIDKHYECLQKLMPRAIPVFVEKPLVASLSHAESLKPYARHIFVMDKWRYHQGVLKLAELVRSGALGQIQSLSCTRWGWRSHDRNVDALWYLLPHDLAIILEILGFLPAVRFARLEHHRDTVSGGIALLGDSPWVEIRVSESRERHQREVRVHGSEAFAILPDSYSPTIALYHTAHASNGHSPSPELIPVVDEMPLLAELHAFVAYLQGGVAPKSGFADALAIVAAVERIHELG
jgi:predicted dehydrogenase